MSMLNPNDMSDTYEYRNHNVKDLQKAKKRLTIVVVLLSIALVASLVFMLDYRSIAKDNSGELGSTSRDKAAFALGYNKALDDLDVDVFIDNADYIPEDSIDIVSSVIQDGIRLYQDNGSEFDDYMYHYK